MLTRYYQAVGRFKHVRSIPGGAYLDGFVEQLFEVGYSCLTARRYIRAAEHLLHWADRQKFSIMQRDDSLANKFQNHLRQCRCPGFGVSDKVCLARGASGFLGFLWDCHVTSVSARKRRPEWVPIINSFREWMRLHHNTGDGTLYNYCLAVDDLLQWHGEDTNQLNANILRTFVVERSRLLGKSKSQCMVSGLRAFVRFLGAEGLCPMGLDSAVPRIAHWGLSELPRYLQPGDVEQILSSCDTETAIGTRDRAIILLLSRLALRAGDLVCMRASDIDWGEGQIRLCGKGLREVRLPLSKEVGDALAAYVTRVRPRTDSDILFIRSRPPFRGFATHGAISVIVAAAMNRAGIVRPCRGAAHLLRHTAATSLLREGASLQDVAKILRHRSIETTAIYAKVDIVALREIAQPWPEVEQ